MRDRATWKNALNEFSLAIQKYPQYAVAYSNRGAAYMQVKKFYKAREDLQMAVQYAPNVAIAHYNLAALYSQEKQFDRALDSLDTALSLGFDNFDAIRNDPDLARLRKQPEFKTVLEKHRISLSR